MIQLKSRGKDKAREIISQREIEEGTDQNSKPLAFMTESVLPFYYKRIKSAYIAYIQGTVVTSNCDFYLG